MFAQALARQALARQRLASALAGLLVIASSVLFMSPAQPASAATSQFKGVNWADTRDNYNPGWVIPDGLSASNNYSQVYSTASSYANAFKTNLGANTMRLPINPPSVSQSWWGAYQGAVDASLDNGMKVIISAWTERTSVGTITDMNAWNSMWNTVVNKYSGNSNVYFEPLNEPYGYSSSQWISICTSWLSAHSNVPKGRVIISGTGYNDHVTAVGGAPALNGTLLSLHYYATWNNYTQESQWQSDISSRIGGYTSRTIIDEFGAPMTTGTNYLTHHNGALDQSYFAAITDMARSQGMGTVYWAGLKTGDNYSIETHNGSGLSNSNSSGVTQLRWGWGY